MIMIKEKNVIEAYEMAKERYASLGVDTEKAMEQLQKISRWKFLIQIMRN